MQQSESDNRDSVNEKLKHIKDKMLLKRIPLSLSLAGPAYLPSLLDIRLLNFIGGRKTKRRIGSRMLILILHKMLKLYQYFLSCNTKVIFGMLLHSKH